MTPAKFKTQFIKKVQRTDNAYSFYFKRPANFDFTAGQYNRWIIPIDNPDERGNSRYFTIASAPSEKDHLMITTKIGMSSFKKSLLTLPAEQEIEIFGPLGAFVLSEPSSHHIFIAGGIGITPYHSMVTETAENNQSVPITLFASWSTSDEVIFQDEFENLQKNHSWFSYRPTVTKPEESEKPWEGLVGRIDKNMILKTVADTANCIFYLCGPPAMVDALRKTVEEMGTAENRIKIEKFTGY